MDTKHLNDVQIIAHVGQLLLQQRFDELGAAACSDERVLRQLASILRQAQPPSFMFAGVALSKAGAPAIPALLEALGDGQFPVRQMAGLALGDIGDPRTVASLVQALGDPQAVVRQAAAHALGKIGVADAVEPLLACLADESDQVRNAAVKALGLIGDKRALDALRRVAAKDSETIAQSARQAIDKISGERPAVPGDAPAERPVTNEPRKRGGSTGSEGLIAQLKKAGWADFSPGEFLGVEFDAIGTAKLARNNWFALLKSIPVLDVAGLDAWNERYAQFAKKSPAGMFSSGKYFVLLLLVDTVGADAVERFARGPELGILKNPEQITRGGGYTMMVIKDRKQILMPKEVALLDALRANDFAKQTHQAVIDWITSL